MKNVQTALSLVLTVAAFTFLGCEVEPAVEGEPEASPEPACVPAAEGMTTKVLVMLDVSGSLQFTDQSAARLVAVGNLVQELSETPDTLVSTSGFGIFGYASPPVRESAPVFQNSSEWVQPEFLGVADVLTDYQQALKTIESMLRLDMQQTTAEELENTRYIVAFVSDGSPTPVCCVAADESLGNFGAPAFGCAAESWELAVSERPYCEGAAESSLCNNQEALDTLRGRELPSAMPQLVDGPAVAMDAFTVGGDYNRRAQIEEAASRITTLRDEFSVGELKLHTRLLYDDSLSEELLEIYRLNHCRASSMLEEVSRIGEGSYGEFDPRVDTTFIDVDIDVLGRCAE